MIKFKNTKITKKIVTFFKTGLIKYKPTTYKINHKFIEPSKPTTNVGYINIRKSARIAHKNKYIDNATLNFLLDTKEIYKLISEEHKNSIDLIESDAKSLKTKQIKRKFFCDLDLISTQASKKSTSGKLSVFECESHKISEKIPSTNIVVITTNSSDQEKNLPPKKRKSIRTSI